MSTTSFRLDQDLVDKLDRIANKLDRSKAWIINDALRKYIEAEERKQQMLEETIEAIADIEASRIVSGEEVMQWLETWGSDKEIDPPQCK